MKSTTSSFIVGLILCLLTIHPTAHARKYTDEQRLAQYHSRGHTYPLKEFVPNTEGWARLMKQRFRQVEAITDLQQKWDGWIETMTSALTTQNYTEFGWGLTQAPQELTEEIRAAIYEGLPRARSERKIDVINASRTPLFIDRPDLTRKVRRRRRRRMSMDHVQNAINTKQSSHSLPFSYLCCLFFSTPP